MEKFANNASSTLGSAMLAGDTNLIVASVVGFPGSGNFRLRVENEILLVTAVAGINFTVSRGQEGTAASDHPLGASVFQTLTAGALDALHTDIVQAGFYGNRPTAGGGNALYLPTDGQVFFVDDGTEWRPMLNGILGHEVAPGNSLVGAGFSLYNVAPTASSVIGGCPFIFHTSNGATQNLCGYEVAKTAGQTLVCSFIPWPTPNSASGVASVGIFALDLSSGHLQGFNLAERPTNGSPLDSTNFVVVDNYTNGTTYSSTPFNMYANFVGKGSRVWFRIQDVSGTLNYAYSNDGANWVTLFSDNTWVPSGGDHFGFYVNSYSQDAGITAQSWKVT